MEPDAIISRRRRGRPTKGTVLATEQDIRDTAHLSQNEASSLLGIDGRTLARMRQRLRLPATIFSKSGTDVGNVPRISESVKRRHPAYATVEVTNGVVLVGSDCHYWPGEATTAHRAFVRFAKQLKPRAVILNGDVVDGASISRFPDIGWEKKPSLLDELGAAQERLREICAASPRAEHIWTLGNHDMRFEMRLAAVAPQYAGIHGVHLRDHFPDWRPAWTCLINDGAVEVTHRFKGGANATYNNTLHAGVTMVTGHLHALQVTRFTDRRGDRWGVDGGTMADREGDQFINYTEASPRNWASGFVVLSFDGGRLTWPEVVHVVDEENGVVSFRGKLIEV